MNGLHHLSIIMDGNGRWAQRKNLDRSRGHIYGAKKAFEIIEYASKIQLQTLSLFAFSTENWQRPVLEVELLMKLLSHTLKRKRRFLAEHNIQLSVIGERTQLSESLVEAIETAEAESRGRTGLKLVIALNYSGQTDICQAVKRLYLSGHDFANVLSSDLENFLWTKHHSKPDLIIRTGGESRLSNFFLWQAAYSEIHFQQKLWPDFEIADLHGHLNDFFKTERRFGKISAQL